MVRTLGLLFTLSASLAACEDVPPPDAESAPPLQTRWRDHGPLRIQKRRDGLQEIDLTGRAQHRALVVVTADGGVRRACSTSPDLARVGVPPLPEPSEPVQVQ